MCRIEDVEEILKLLGTDNLPVVHGNRYKGQQCSNVGAEENDTAEENLHLFVGPEKVQYRKE